MSSRQGFSGSRRSPAGDGGRRLRQGVVKRLHGRRLRQGPRGDLASGVRGSVFTAGRLTEGRSGVRGSVFTARSETFFTAGLHDKDRGKIWRLAFVEEG
ncbi:hypothetical protein Csa_017823 [Cucumis sativus]|nr:hypothetical protein Csa_017823 [Cucumis sativus]